MTVYRKMTKMLLILILVTAAAFPVNVFAATGDTNSIDFDSSAKVELTVGQTPKQLKVYANIEGSSSKKDVTAASTWVSSNTNAVRVVNGLLTPVDTGTAMITATYLNAVATLEVSVTHPFKDLTLERRSDGNYKLGDSEETLLVTAKATGGQSATSVKDVSADADWSSSNTGVLTIDEGQITLVGEGTATITAKYKGLTATFKAKVELPYSAIVLKQDNVAVKELELLVGDDPVVLKAMTKATENSEEKPVSDQAEWTSSSESVATVEAGIITVVGSGKAVITAKYLGVSKSVDVYVRAPYEAVLLTPSEDQTLFLGESLTVKAEMRNAVNSRQNQSSGATWTSDNLLAATVTKDAAAATVTGKAVGSAVIKAESFGVSKTLKVTVLPTITELVLDKSELEAYTADSVSLPKVSGTKLDGTKLDISQEIKWTSANEEIAEIKDNKLSAVKAGTVTLTGKIKKGNVSSGASPIREKTVELKVTVQNKVLVLIGPEDALGLVIGEEQGLPSVNAVLENGDEVDVTSTITWEITGTNAVLKQTANGKVIKGLTKGSATLKGTYSNKTISIPVTIEQKVVKLVVEPGTVDLNLKASKAIKVTGYFANGKSANFSGAMNWESSNTAVATVKGTTVKAVAEGTATMTGSYQGIAATVKVNVVPKLTKLTVNETKLVLAAGASQSVVATALYDTGKTAIVTGSVVWTSSKPAVAKVNASGTITAVGKGTASIKGKWNNKTVTVTVNVK
ncbi:Ig-like domain-containing protein [Paenibacillus typhae]|uniref:Ig-like domain (Group 2) n=2 Tax=Paenibacillus typhae TaxID=1174501 RepID=A0A1G8I1F8_9BACL|nr:Ig-like domain-containing protein [Paenibacillus typhae]SDI12642.1 Ig-like domain (group 2) [Paenibacillus typhae]